MIERLIGCYREDPILIPVELQPWFTKFAKQQKVLNNILKVAQKFDDTANCKQEFTW